MEEIIKGINSLFSIGLSEKLRNVSNGVQNKSIVWVTSLLRTANLEEIPQCERSIGNHHILVF